MASQLTTIGAILFSTAFFVAGNGLILTLTPLRASLEGFGPMALGVLGAFYYAGFVAGCFAGPRIIARAGHIRAFTVSASLTAVTILFLPMSTVPFAWFVLRAMNGLFVAVLYMTLESWLNERATNETRGSILSAYVVVNLIALIVGQWFLLSALPSSFELFTIGAALLCFCVVPVGLTRLPQPIFAPVPRLSLTRLFALSPVGVLGCMTSGIANSAFWTLGPVYAQSLAFTTAGLATFMTVFIAGGALIQWPVGRLSDGMDRRWIIAAICTAASVCGIALGLFGWLLVRGPGIFFGAVFALGAAMLPLYSLSIAHANDRLSREQFVEASAALLLVQAAASVPGPMLAALVTSAAGPHALFLFTALAHAAMAFFAFTRTRLREAPPEENREAFAAVPHGSPAALELDPRGPDQAA